MTAAPAGRPPPRVHVIPARTNTLGMWLFLITLILLFASGMLAYVFIRLVGAGMPEPGAFRPAMLDVKLYASTAVVLLASLTVHMAVVRVKRERLPAFRRWLWATNVLAVLFVAIQTPAMIDLLRQDSGLAGGAFTTEIRETRLYAILFFFVLIHAAHVLGGIVYLAVVTVRAYQGKYDHEHNIGVRHAALYWHFLDVVWICMFGTFLVIG